MQKSNRRRRRSQEAESISLGISARSRHRSKVYIQRNTGLSSAVFALVKAKKRRREDQSNRKNAMAVSNRKQNKAVNNYNPRLGSPMMQKPDERGETCYEPKWPLAGRNGDLPESRSSPPTLGILHRSRGDRRRRARQGHAGIGVDDRDNLAGADCGRLLEVHVIKITANP